MPKPVELRGEHTMRMAKKTETHERALKEFRSQQKCHWDSPIVMFKLFPSKCALPVICVYDKWAFNKEYEALEFAEALDHISLLSSWWKLLCGGESAKADLAVSIECLCRGMFDRDQLDVLEVDGGWLEWGFVVAQLVGAEEAIWMLTCMHTRSGDA